MIIYLENISKVEVMLEERNGALLQCNTECECVCVYVHSMSHPACL